MQELIEQKMVWLDERRFFRVDRQLYTRR